MKRNCMILPFAIAAMVYAHDDKTDHVHTMDKIVVSDSAQEKLSTKLTREEINKANSSRTVDGLLLNVAGVDVARAGGTIKSQGISIRGFNEMQYVVVLNGRRLNGSGVMGGEFIDWNSIPVDQIESIEILRGAKTAEYDNASGGVIKITTIKPITGSRTNARFTYGVTPDVSDKRILDQSFDAGFSHSDNIGDFLEYTLNLGHWQNEGYLRNNHNKRTNVGGNFTIHLPAEFDLQGSVIISRTDRGFILKNDPDDKYYDPSYPESDENAGGGPGIGWNRGDFYFGDRSHWMNTRKQFDAALIKRFDNLTLKLSGFLNDQDRTERFYAISDSNDLVLERFAKPEDMTSGWSLKADHLLNGHDLKYGLDGFSLQMGGREYREMDSAYFSTKWYEGNVNSELERKNNVNQFGAYVQDNFNLRDTLINIHGGFRYDYYKAKPDVDADIIAQKDLEEVVHHGYSPNAGVKAFLWNGGALGLDFAYNFRMPNPPEYSWYYYNYQPENRKELSPEEALQFELAVEQRLLENRLSLAARGYSYRVENYLRRVSKGQAVENGKLTPDRVCYNIDEVKFLGAELEMSYRFPKFFTLWGNYSYQQNEKEGDILTLASEASTSLPELPKNKGNAGLSFISAKGVQADIVMRSVGEKEYVDIEKKKDAEGNTIPVPVAKFIDPFTTINLNGTVPVIKNDEITLNIRAGIENLFNVEYEEEPGFPMPGITFLAGIEASF